MMESIVSRAPHTSSRNIEVTLKTKDDIIRKVPYDALRQIPYFGDMFSATSTNGVIPCPVENYILDIALILTDPEAFKRVRTALDYIGCDLLHTFSLAIPGDPCLDIARSHVRKIISVVDNDIIGVEFGVNINGIHGYPDIPGDFVANIKCDLQEIPENSRVRIRDSEYYLDIVPSSSEDPRDIQLLIAPQKWIPYTAFTTDVKYLRNDGVWDLLPLVVDCGFVNNRDKILTLELDYYQITGVEFNDQIVLPSGTVGIQWITDVPVDDVRIAAGGQTIIVSKESFQIRCPKLYGFGPITHPKKGMYAMGFARNCPDYMSLPIRGATFITRTQTRANIITLKE